MRANWITSYAARSAAHPRRKVMRVVTTATSSAEFMAGRETASTSRVVDRSLQTMNGGRQMSCSPFALLQPVFTDGVDRSGFSTQPIHR